MENPYQSPAAAPASVKPDERSVRSPSWLRGFAYAVPLFFVGAAIPFLLPLIGFAVEAMSDSNAELKLFNSVLTGPCFACGVLFFLAALRNYSPPKFEGYVTCLMVVGIFGLVGLIFSALVSFVFFPPMRRSYDQGASPQALITVVMAISIPACYTYFATSKQMKNHPQV